MNWYSLQYRHPGNELQRIDLPTSKSISNRLLILHFISEKKFEIDGLSMANDTVLLNKILSQSILPQDINCKDAGTVLRFMTCLCATQENKSFKLSGTSRLLERPMQELLDCLIKLGAHIEQLTLADQSRPVSIKGSKLVSKPISISGNISSQFISGLCLIASQIENGLDLTIDEPILSKPYITMTLELMAQLGVRSTFEKNRIKIPQQKITGRRIKIEADWSAACFFYAYLILSKDIDSIFINALDAYDIQGDRYISKLGNQFGIRTTFESGGALLTRVQEPRSPISSAISFKDYPDLAIPLLVVCAFQHPELVFMHLEHLKIKESNRIAAISHNLEKFGISLIENNEQVVYSKQLNFKPADTILIKTFNDHRIAMSFALLATLGYNIQLDSISCIDKSFPTFLDQIDKLGIRLKK